MRRLGSFSRSTGSAQILWVSGPRSGVRKCVVRISNNPDGRLTSDPAAFYGPHQSGGSPNPREGLGAIRAMGEHKGSGLAFMMELLAGALTGSGCAGPGPRRIANGMLSIYLTPEAFGAADDFAAEVRTYVDFFKSARPTVDGGEVLVPGEPERRMRAARLVEGIPIPEPTWRAIQETAQDLGV